MGETSLIFLFYEYEGVDPLIVKFRTDISFGASIDSVSQCYTFSNNNLKAKPLTPKIFYRDLGNNFNEFRPIV